VDARWITFDPYRTLGLAGVDYLKPELMFREQQRLRAARGVLFPEYWQVNTLLYGFGKRVFPSPASYHLGHDKAEQTRALWALCPEHVPHTAIHAATPAALEQILDEFAFPLVAKELRNSMGRGVHLLDGPRALRAYAERNPVLYVQEYLPLQRDLRVVFVGDEVATAYWRHMGADGFHTNVAQGGTVDFAGVPTEALALVRWVARGLGVDHAGFDVAEVEGRYYFLEFNVRFGNQGLREHGVDLVGLIRRYLGMDDEPPREPPCDSPTLPPSIPR